MISGLLERLRKRLKAPHQLVTDRARRHFDAEGYIVIRNVVPAGLALNAVREIGAFVGADLADSATSRILGPTPLAGSGRI